MHTGAPVCTRVAAGFLSVIRSALLLVRLFSAPSKPRLHDCEVGAFGFLEPNGSYIFECSSGECYG